MPNPTIKPLFVALFMTLMFASLLLDSRTAKIAARHRRASSPSRSSDDARSLYSVAARRPLEDAH